MKRKKIKLTYFFKKSSSTTAEMSRRGLPIPRRTPSKPIVDARSVESFYSLNLFHSADEINDLQFIIIYRLKYVKGPSNLACFWF